MTFTRVLRSASDDTNDAGAANTRDDQIAAEFFQLVRDNCGGAMHIALQLGVGVDVLAPECRLVGDGGDAVGERLGSRRVAGKRQADDLVALLVATRAE